MLVLAIITLGILQCRCIIVSSHTLSMRQLTLIFVCLSNYGVPLHLIRELYETFRNFKLRVADYLRYRKITSNMNDRFPDATAEELNAWVISSIYSSFFLFFSFFLIVILFLTFTNDKINWLQTQKWCNLYYLSGGDGHSKEVTLWTPFPCALSAIVVRTTTYLPYVQSACCSFWK